jgi:hypothetical protein
VTPHDQTRTATPADEGLPPWQFFLLCGMLAATAVVIVATGQSLANIIILSLTIVAASFVGLTAYRTLSPLVSGSTGITSTLVGGRTRAALEREKALVLRSIKELEFDCAMGKVSQADFDEMAGRLRRRAMGLIQQLDANVGYRDQIERELARLVAASAPTAPSPASAAVSSSAGPAAPAGATCGQCDTVNDLDARFCKQCGTKLAQP